MLCYRCASRYGGLFVITFLVLTRWLRNVEMNYSYHSAIMKNPILLVVNIFIESAPTWTLRFEENHT